MPTLIHPRPDEALDPALIDRWRAIPVAVASDVTGAPVVLDPAIRPLAPGARLCAPALTAWCERGDFGAVLHALDLARPGEALALAADGRADTAVIGELLAGAARAKGLAGLVVDGAVRDVASLGGWPDFPVWTRRVTPRGPLSKERGAVGGAVALGGVTVASGDLLLGDADGVAALSPVLARTAINAAEARVAAENGWRGRLAAGESPLAVFEVPASRAAPPDGAA